MSVCITKAGVHYRSRCMPHHRATAFAAALAANARFESVALEESRRAKGAARWFVTFHPVSEERQEAIRRQQQESREERALAQGSEYLWCRDPRGFVWCLSTSGEVYEVVPGRECSCPDFAYRCAAARIDCKHLVALALGLGQMTEFDLPLPEAA